MAQWYVKDLSKLTGVSVQTLHHYDRINLLNPSIRLPNGYRVYSEKDLLKLQQIIALKFFGFELAKIKNLLAGNIEVLAHFAAQARFLEEQAQKLKIASQTLKDISTECESDKSIPWENIIKSIEVYHMVQNIEHEWVKEIFTPSELKDYVAFETELKKSSPQEKANFEKNWANLVRDLQSHLKSDPTSEIGVELGGRCMNLINELYGTKYAHLRTKIFEKGFGEGKGLNDVGLTPEIVKWLDVAVDAYWRKRVLDVLAQIDKIPSDTLLKKWDALLTEIYGDNEQRKKGIFDLVMKDESVSEKAKQWLAQVGK